MSFDDGDKKRGVDKQPLTDDKHGPLCRIVCLQPPVWEKKNTLGRRENIFFLIHPLSLWGVGTENKWVLHCDHLLLCVESVDDLAGGVVT